MCICVRVCVQVPVLFTGTMRSNLDPFERHSDMDIWAALRRAHLARVVESNPLGLEMTLAEGGAPLSAGQKQLVALARALLRNSKVRVVAYLVNVTQLCMIGCKLCEIARLFQVCSPTS